MGYVVGVGACNVDFYVKTDVEIKKNYDHPSKISSSNGGVTRNILETLGILGVKTYILTCIGDDKFGEYIKDKSKDYVDFTYANIIKDTETSKFIQIFDNHNDMLMACCDMSIINNVDIDYIKNNDELLKNASAIIVDPSIRIDVIKYIIDTYKDNKIFLDPISNHYADVIRPYVKDIYVLKPNSDELSSLVNKEIKNEQDIIDAGNELLKRGVKNIVVTTGGNGSYLINDDGVIKVKFKTIDNVVNASGAGDSFFAALIYSFINNYDPVYSLELANAAGIAAIKSKTTTNNNLSVKILMEIIKENKI